MDPDAARIPVDDSLLRPLGLVTWASVVLHHSIRDAIGLLSPDGLTDAPFERTLGNALRDLRSAALDAGADPVVAWVDEVGKPAQELRDGVQHAVPFTSSDGQNALRGSKPTRPDRYDEETLDGVAGDLFRAWTALAVALSRR